MRFYGLSLREIENTPKRLIMALWEGIERLEAQEMMIDMKTSSYPYMNKKSASQLFNRVSKKSQGRSK